MERITIEEILKMYKQGIEFIIEDGKIRKSE